MDERRALVLAKDTDLLDDLLRLAAAAQCELHRVPDVTAARQCWACAPLVLLDEVGAVECAAAGMPRRDGVLVVCREQPPATVWQQAVVIGAEKVLTLPESEPWLINALSDVVERPSAAAGGVLAVLGGRGGAGASVLAAATAVVALRRGRRVLLVDCDPLGGGLDLVLGAEHSSGLRWPGLALSGGRVAVSALRAALPSHGDGPGELTILSCDRNGGGPDAQAVASIIEAGQRAGETVICDLPRHLPAPALAGLDRANLAVLVVPAEVRACAAAARVAEHAASRGVPIQLVVRGPSPGGLGIEDIASALGLPLLTGMRPEPGLEAALDRGQSPARSRGPLASAAGAVLDALHAITPRDPA